MKPMKKLLPVMLLALPLYALADESTDVSAPAAQAGQDFKNVGKEWGKGNVGEGFVQIGHGFRDGAKTTGHAFKKAFSGKSSDKPAKADAKAKVEVKKEDE